MMLKMHVADNDVVGKIGLALFARGERHGNQARVFVRNCPGRHRPKRNNKRNCEDKSDEQLAQFTPSMNRSIISMLPATEHVSIHNNSLLWSKDCLGHCRFRAKPMLVQNGGESVFARAKIRSFPIVAIEFLT
jgi:hypothetical protein